MVGTFYAAPAPDAPPYVKVGDKVLYSKYGGTEIKYEGDEYLIMSEDQILAVIQ